MPKKADPLRNHIIAVDVTNEFRFCEPDKVAITLELTVIDVSLTMEQMKSLLHDMESEITVFLGELIYEDNLPTKAEIKASLNVVADASKYFLSEFSALNSVANNILSDHLSIETDQYNYQWDCETRVSSKRSLRIEAEQQHLNQLNSDINDAIKATEKMPGAKGGPKKKGAKVRFGAGLASVLRKHMPSNIKIAATHGKLFENMLVICIEAATEETIEDAHQLALDSIKKEKIFNEHKKSIIDP